MDADSVSALARRNYGIGAGEHNVDELLSDDLISTSADDPGIDRATYFERRWPDQEQFGWMQIEKLFRQKEGAFVRDVAARAWGERFRSPEYVRVEGARIEEVVVYYGAPASPLTDGW